MYDRGKAFVTKHDLLCSSQHGFRESYTTEHALLDIVNKIQTNMDAKLFSRGIFIDFKKGLDTVDHEILLHKLSHYGIRGIVNNRSRSYLSGRCQATQAGRKISKKQKVVCGVPKAWFSGHYYSYCISMISKPLIFSCLPMTQTCFLQIKI